MLLIIFLLCLQPGLCLQITGIGVPSTAFSGDKVRLTCSFDLHGDELYSLTWWKDEKMFFNFVPKNARPKNVYQTPGITVDEQRSNLHEVILSRVDHRASGKLKCEVLAESFEQDTMVKNMTVIDLPTRGPTIIGFRGNYQVGDLLLLNCSCPPSYPTTTLSWHINGNLASRETVIVFPGESDSMGRKASLSGLQMWLRSEHFTGGQGLLLRCTASILDLYRKSTDVLITDSNYIASSPREGASTGGSGSYFATSALILTMALTALVT
ncbi:uncharacterized protein LOC135215337 [Macrobrachium nipponense]|uniref:uncharacterized protein LOC135215337 n=1 Tax=Macrobrachium nipponense TaxID=159736 RepID=UPI0030C8BBB0